MAYVTEEQLRAASRREVASAIYKTERILLRESRDTTRTSFDVFLSHSKIDEALVLGAKKILEEKGYSVYVDWIDDPLLDRSAVTRRTAETIRARMRQSKSMFYLHSNNSTHSKWCPWELGYFDAMTHPARKVFVVPILRGSETYSTQEYLSLYDTVEITSVGVVSRDRGDVRIRNERGEFQRASMVI